VNNQRRKSERNILLFLEPFIQNKRLKRARSDEEVEAAKK
jgi:hypothetical protein